jgi:hypothetical protein
MTADNPDKLAWEARAKIMWGDSTDDVEDWLTDNGLSSQQAADILDRCLEERDVEFRKRGFLEIIIGLALVVGPLAFVGIMVLALRMIHAGLAGLCYLVVLYGLYRLGRGVCWVVRGGRNRGSLASHE